MAGQGRRTFAPGEVLTSTNVMEYLQDQAVMNFAGTAARGSAIGTAVSEGMVSYLQDTDSIEVYDGTVWQQVYPVTDSGWQTLSITAGGWTVAETVQYRKIGDVVYFRGELFGGTVGATVIATVPDGYRPPVRVAFPILDFGAGTSDGRLQIATNGQVQIYGANGGASSPGLTLTSVSYALA